MKNKNILITGGFGFIGSHIVDQLLENNNITIIDNLSTGKISNIKNIEHRNLTIIKKDLNELKFSEIQHDIDYIFHLAAMTSVPESVNNPLKCNYNNVNATVRLLDYAVKNNVKKIIFSSSSAVYGDNLNMPLKETEPLMPLSPYAASKGSCEQYLKSFHESYGLKFTSLRYFNVFGPRQDENSQYAAVIPKFIYSLLNNKQPKIYGDGTQTRDFIFVGDVAKANIAASKSNYDGIINIASGQEININQLFDIISNIINSNIEPKYLPERPGDIKYSLADISNMKKINFNSSNNLKVQLQETIDWFKYKLKDKN